MDKTPVKMEKNPVFVEKNPLKRGEMFCMDIIFESFHPMERKAT